MKSRKWTNKDLGILRREFPKRPTPEVAKMLGRSVMAVATKASKEGLKKQELPGIKWTPQMLKILTDFFPIMFNRPLALWLQVSQRTMLRKARELGLEKQEGFLDKRRKDISRLAGEALRKIPDRKNSRFKKGVHFNPDGEFKKGHKESPETKAKRIASLKESWRRRKAAKVRYY